MYQLIILNNQDLSIIICMESCKATFENQMILCASYLTAAVLHTIKG